MSSLAQSILPHLPYLRRFARSLTGRQQSGDAYVAAVLEALVADPTIFPKDTPVRAALYSLFLKSWRAIDINTRTEPAEADLGIVDRRIGTLTPMPRQAFLLVAMENFSAADTAKILDVSADELAGLLEVAAREIAEQVATDVLIIEDEPLIALDLEGVVTSLGHRVTHIARTRAEAVASIARKRPSLILADIQLADGSSGLDAVKDILGTIDVPVIFITAYPEQVLTGKRPEPTFLIPKPFQHETVKAVMSQALFFDLKPTRVAA